MTDVQNRDLPMAPAGCTLPDGQLTQQLARYRQLGSTALSVEQHNLALTVTFSPEVNLELLRETIAIERGCCSFFTLAYDEPDRRLSITVADPGSVDALRPLLSALTEPSVRR